MKTETKYYYYTLLRQERKRLERDVDEVIYRIQFPYIIQTY